MNNPRFEKLLEDFMFGEIDLDRYRYQRTRLVQDIISSKNKDSQINNLDYNQITETVKPSFQVPTLQKAPVDFNFRHWKLMIISLLVVSSGLLIYLFDFKVFVTSDKTVDNANNIKVNDIQSTNNKKNNLNLSAEEPFIIAFNANNSWDTETISNFLIQWQSLTREQQILARQSNGFLELGKILQKKIEGQQQNKNSEQRKPSRMENLLIWFSSQLSIPIKIME